MAKILVVDDSSTVRDEVAGFLRRNGLDVDTAVDGKDGLAKLRSNPGVKLVVSDVNMPNMDGLEFIKAVRAKGISVPIVMITTEGGEDILKEAMSSGASDSIKKPFTPDQLNEKLGGLL